MSEWQTFDLYSGFLFYVNSRYGPDMRLTEYPNISIQIWTLNSKIKNEFKTMKYVKKNENDFLSTFFIIHLDILETRIVWIPDT